MSCWRRLAAKFPENARIAYDLPKYACLLNNPDEARTRMQTAFRLTRDPRVREAALEDPDFKLLWDEIRQHG